MIIRIGILAVGLLLVLVTVLRWKKSTVAWRVSLLLTSVLVTGIGGLCTFGLWQQLHEDQQYVYLALRYLENSDTDAADYYLKKVNGDTFDSLCAESLLEGMRNNDVLARMKLDGATAKAGSEAQQALTLRISALAEGDGQAWQETARDLRDQLPLSDSRVEQMEQRFSAESSYASEAAGTTEYRDDAESLRQQVSRSLGYGDFGTAVTTASRLVGDHASAGNRLLLAEAIAEATYGGYSFSGNEFATPGENGNQEAAGETERESLQKQLDDVAKQIDDVDILLWETTEQEKIQELSTRKETLVTRQQELQDRYDYIFALRAFNSIADIHSLDAEVVRARLYFAMNDYATAVERLQKASGSLAARFTTDTSLRNALNVLNESYAGNQNLGVRSQEFRSAVNTVLTTGAMDYVGISTTPLTENFTSYVVSGLQEYGKDLYATSIDLSNFPEVTVTLAGRDTVVQNLIDGGTPQVRDTQQDVNYTISAVEGENAQRNVVCVVDESGSMIGDPLRDAQSALTGFIAGLDDGFQMALVSFDDSARIQAEMGSNKTALQAAVEQIGAGGGTDINAGIEMAMEAAEGREGATTVLLMTDGQSNLDMEIVEEAANRGLVIHTIGFGSVDDDLLQRIADATGGQYIRADSSSELIGVYMSLVGMIGNQVQVHYTAPEQVGEAQRYFFLRDEENNVSVHVEYTLSQKAQPEITGVNRGIIFTNEVTSAQERGASLTLNLYGKNLGDVTGVTVGGLPAEINTDGSDDEVIYIEFPASLSVGWQNVELTEADGTVTTFEHVLAVGDSFNCRNFHYGPININAYNAVLMSDGTLVIANGTLDDVTEVEEQRVSTLSAYFSGVLTATVDYASAVALVEEQGYNAEITLDAAQPLKGMGTVELRSDDSGYDNNTSGIIATGEYLLQGDGNQIKLIQQ